MQRAEEEEEEEETRQRLPAEVLFFEILTRLPVKSLLRFRCISTLWDSTFSDPSFVRSHFSLSLNRPSGLTLLISIWLNYSKMQIFSATIPTKTHHQIIQSKPASASATLHPTIPDPSNIYVTCPPYVSDSLQGLTYIAYVSDSLQGLTCIAYASWDRKWSQIYIYNPSTREIITVPTPTNTDAKANYYSFGFDPVSNEHKVLMTPIIMGNPNKEEEKEIMEHKVYSVRSNQWRRIANVAQPYDACHHSLYFWDNSLCFNGFIYRTGFIKMKDFVIVFNVGTENFRFFPLPYDSNGLSPTFTI